MFGEVGRNFAMQRIEVIFKSVEDVLMDVTCLCDTLELEYAVMGGLAVRVHGIPRPTYDVDFQLAVNNDMLNRFFDEAERIGYTVSDVFRSGWRDTVGGMPLVKLKTYLASGVTVDVDIFLNETPFQKSLMNRRVSVDFAGARINFVTAEDLVLLKLIASRPRDLGDVGDILFVQGSIDIQYMNHWAKELGIMDRLTQALSESQ